jgi:transcriptional regulator with XRE-family HTH domain
MNQFIESKTAIVLKERFERQDEGGSNSYAKFLKRKRTEQRRTLEDVSKGVCSPSYLSKIENNTVEVSEDYFKALCENLDIKYEEIKKERNDSIFMDMLKKYIAFKNKDIKLMIEKAIASGAYCETEVEIMLLFNNILEGLYEEAKILIQKLEDIKTALTTPELLNFVFLTALYLEKTGQSKKAFEYILILQTINFDNELLKQAIYDLAIDIYYKVGKYSLIGKCFFYIEKNNYNQLFSKRLIIHQFQLLELESQSSYQTAIAEIKSLSSLLDNEYMLDEYGYYLAKIYFNHQNYSRSIQCIMKRPLSARSVTLLAINLDMLNDQKQVQELFPRLINYTFNAHETEYQYHTEMIVNKLNEENAYRQLNYIKDVILPNQKINYDEFLHDLALAELVRLGYTIGKYKDTLKYIIGVSYNY